MGFLASLFGKKQEGDESGFQGPRGAPGEGGELFSDEELAATRKGESLSDWLSRRRGGPEGPGVGPEGGAPEGEGFERAGGQRTYGGRLETNILGMKEYHEYLQPGDNPPMNTYYGDEAQAAFDRADGGEATTYGPSGGRDPYEGH